MTRFVVRTVTGFAFHMPLRSSGGSGGGSGPGITAHVCDSVYLYEVVASYRSEHRRDGHAAAVRDAEAHAARLNDGS